MDEIELQEVIDQIKKVQELLTDEQRMQFWHEIQAMYCTYCGRDDPGCKCWNDE